MTKVEISFSDFQKLDFRVGKVVSATQVNGSTSLIKLEVDLGEDVGKRNILAGVAKWYKADELTGKKFIFVVNLASKRMMGEVSYGMMLAADVDSKARILPIDDKIPEGTVVR